MPSAIFPADLRCEYLTDPLGTTVVKPRLSWLVTTDERDQTQTAYQVLVASSPGLLAQNIGDLWDSGTVKSTDTHLIEYEGEELTSRQRCHWKVRVWDNADSASDWSEPAMWSIGLTELHEWNSRWAQAPASLLAAADREDRSIMPSPYLRTEFELNVKPVRATLYATAQGLYRFHANGQRVGQDWFTPGWTDYAERYRFQTYDLTDHLEPGTNAVGAILGTGWYCGHVAWYTGIYGDEPALLAQLEIEMVDGNTLTIGSGPGWKAATGPILFSDMLQGESYDARLEIPGWDLPGYDDSGWVAAVCKDFDPDGPALDGSTGVPMREISEVLPVEITEPSQGVYVFDLGQNMVGNIRLRATGEEGDTVRLRYAEVLNDDGTIYTENLRKAAATDSYTLKGSVDGEEWVPSFTYHGFRFVEVSGLRRPASLDQITGLVIHSAMDQTGTFSCSNELLNQLQHNIEWGQRGNYFDIPTDCPQRDERLGWMGDAQVFAATGCFNFNTAAFLTKWLTDVRDAQHKDGCYTDFAPEPDVIEHNSGRRLREWRGAPAWADAGIIVPWTVYQRYGDVRILEESYDSMCTYMGFIEQESKDLIGPDFGYGDWLGDFAFTPLELLATAFNAHSAGVLSDIAGVIGKDSDAARYRAFSDRIKEAFNRRFVTPDGRIVGDTQTAYALALRFNLLPEELRYVATDRLVHDIEHGHSAMWPYKERAGHISSGFVGVNLINPVLIETGHIDLAYRLLLNEDYPSWLFQVRQGATTIWERWDGYHPDHGFQDPDMNSFNHYAYGAIGQWLYETVAGLSPLEPGYKSIAVRPQPGGGLTSARARYVSVHGAIEVSWRTEHAGFVLDVSVPCNTTAHVWLPFGNGSSTTESGRPISKTPGIHDIVDGDVLNITIGSGIYRFETPLLENVGQPRIVR
jgi:alpha-L-rhamnosidase